MEEIYHDASRAGSYGGVDALYRAAQGKVTRKKIKKWLEGVDAYTLHKPVRKKFPTNRVIVYGIDKQWQMDLADMRNIREYNDGYMYILVCIDILSKYAWGVPLKTKRGEEMVKAFQIIFSERKPISIQSDKGSEYLNVNVQSLFKREKIKFFTTNNEAKACIAERFIRTLKGKLYRYFTATGSYRYVDILKEVMLSYNSSYHSSIKRAPKDVTLSNEKDVWFSLYQRTLNVPIKACVFSVGDTVRISKAKLTFEKSYLSGWTQELFIVTECVRREPPVYRIKDLLGESIEGTFYPQELQKTEMKEFFPVDKILKKRTRGDGVEYFVKFRGYSDKFNLWIPASNFV